MDNRFPGSGSSDSSHQASQGARPRRGGVALVATLLAGIAIALSGCGDDSANGKKAQGDEQTKEEVLDTTVGTDKAVTYSDGLKTQVTELSRYTPSASAAGNNDGNVSVKATIKITNNTAGPVDVELADVALLANDQESAEIFDQAGGVAHFTGALEKGKTTTGVYAFSIPSDATGTLVVEVTPDLKHDKATFTGSV